MRQHAGKHRGLYGTALEPALFTSLGEIMTLHRRMWSLTLLFAALLTITGCKSDETGQGTPEEEDNSLDTPLEEEEDEEEEEENDPPGGFLASCETDKDCDSGLCIDNLQGETVCSVRCETHDECEDPNYRCSIYDSQGGDVVRACLPLPPTYCLDCGVGG